MNSRSSSDELVNAAFKVPIDPQKRWNQNKLPMFHENTVKREREREREPVWLYALLPLTVCRLAPTSEITSWYRRRVQVFKTIFFW